MEQKDNSNKSKIGEPVLEFISGNTNTAATKRLTKSIGCLQSLWLLAKMAGIVRKSREN